MRTPEKIGFSKKTKGTDVKSILPWLIGGGGLGGTMFSRNAEAKSLSKCPLKCPSLKEVKKVSNKIEKAKKEFKEIKSKTQNDFNKCAEKIKPLLEVKENYT